MTLRSIKIPLEFLIAGILWALCSSPLISFPKELTHETRELIRTINNLVFVVIAAVVLYFEIKKQQHKLSSSEEQYRNLVEHNPSPMWIYRTNTLEFVKVNHASVDLYGYSYDEFMAMTPTDIRPESERAKFIERVNSIGPGLTKQGVWLHQKKCGELIYASIVTYDLAFNGEPCRLSMISDITDIVLKEEKIKAQNAALHEIAWVNSHQIRKSLCSVMSLVALLKDAQTEHEHKEYISMIETCTDELDEVLKKTNSRVDELKEH
ncbi:PAS domain S-box protein [Mucilaginibacter sp. McL0603]|uniref:PAS domain S-box protein n=1 Tax=Mucilaginibacter sp. McL0603 TaxID=3415670 RepID=UPI003CEF559F